MVFRQQLSLATAIAFCSVISTAQTFNTTERLQGYALRSDSNYVLFDPRVYDKQPTSVALTGPFRSWASTMDNNWLLQQHGEVWVLGWPVEESLLQPQTAFKFLTGNAMWQDPPAAADNVQGGNLIFGHQIQVPTLKAEIINELCISATINGVCPLLPEDYQLTDAAGNNIPIAAVLPNTATQTIIVPANPIDKRRVYFLEIPNQRLKSFCSFDGWFRTLYSNKELGANIHDGNTSIRLFAPRAEQVKLYLYADKNSSQADRVVNMQVDDQGVWEAFFPEDLHGIWYDFTVHGANDPGNHFYETTNKHITDPYSRVSDDTWGKARIWHATKPATPLKNGIPAMQDVIAYEVHIQDFTDLLPVDHTLKGTIPAMTVRGLKNANGEQIGFDYLLDLGINVVHLMPVQEYLHFPDDDWKASFAHDPYMIEQGISEENYDWGYRTSHFFAVESRYRSKGSEPGTEREEFKQLVQAFHDAGIAVIIDIVPNHTAEDMGGDRQYFNFNGIDKMYYYRTKNFEHIGEYGNEVKTENRPMTQRWLIDQCLHFINEFGIDGFRIDLAGQIDQQTLKALKAAIGEDKILYGEAWIGSNDPDYESNPDWDWYKNDAPITFFQDDSRNAYKGPVFDLADKYMDRGWAGGKFSERANVMKGLSKSFPDDKTTLSGISYLDIHDNYALADQFAKSDFDGRFAVDQDLYKIAVTLLYTTPGPIVTHGGSEIMRSKAMAPNEELLKITKRGFKNYIHGKRDTYNLRAPNRFLWEQVGNTPAGNNHNDYKNMQAFWKGMNAFRSSSYGQVFRVAGELPEDYFTWILPAEESKLGYIVDKQVMVLLNPGNSAYSFRHIQLPEGSWKLIAHNRAVNHLEGVEADAELMHLQGGGQYDIPVPAEGLYIWVKE
jgi:pullulanase